MSVTIKPLKHFIRKVKRFDQPLKASREQNASYKLHQGKAGYWASAIKGQTGIWAYIKAKRRIAAICKKTIVIKKRIRVNDLLEHPPTPEPKPKPIPIPKPKLSPKPDPQQHVSHRIKPARQHFDREVKHQQLEFTTVVQQSKVNQMLWTRVCYQGGWVVFRGAVWWRVPDQLHVPIWLRSYWVKKDKSFQE